MDFKLKKINKTSSKTVKGCYNSLKNKKSLLGLLHVKIFKILLLHVQNVKYCYTGRSKYKVLLIIIVNYYC